MCRMMWNFSLLRGTYLWKKVEQQGDVARS